MNEPILYAGNPRIPPPSMQLRSRKEASSRDAVNARMFEEWQTDAPQTREKIQDMNPINTRTSGTDYRQSQPYIPSAPQMGQNPFFDRYDPSFDPRNAIRELRSAVYENKTGERGIEETKRILERGFVSRWLPEGYVEQNHMDTLMSYEKIRPQMDNITKTYRK
jgi:hypothetical protein